MLPTSLIRIQAKNNKAYGEALGELFGDHVRTLLLREQKKDWPVRVKQAMAYWSVSKRYFPQYIEETEAYARACGIKSQDLWTLGLELSLDTDRCTALVTQKGRLVGHVEDFDPKTKDDIVLIERTIGSTTVLELCYVYTLGGNAASINSHGWVQLINTVHSTRARRGVPKNLIARWLSETSSPEKDVAHLAHIPRCEGYAHTFIQAKTGKVSLLESSAKRLVLESIPSPTTHTNHFILPGMMESEAFVSLSSRERHTVANSRLKPETSLGSLKRIMSDTSRGKHTSIFNEDTVAKIIFDHEAKQAHTWFARNAKQGYTKTPLGFL